MSKEHLASYLNDHLAGANFALEILDHLVAETPGSASSLAALRTDIEDDRQQLKTLMASLNILESRVRKAVSWIAERMTEVKLEVDDDPNGSFRRLERLEALAIGIEGKIALWRGLDAIPDNETLRSLKYELLIERGREQRARVEVLRLQAARTALVIS